MSQETWFILAESKAKSNYFPFSKSSFWMKFPSRSISVCVHSFERSFLLTWVMMNCPNNAMRFRAKPWKITTYLPCLIPPNMGNHFFSFFCYYFLDPRYSLLLDSKSPWPSFKLAYLWFNLSNQKQTNLSNLVVFRPPSSLESWIWKGLLRNVFLQLQSIYWPNHWVGKIRPQTN